MGWNNTDKDVVNNQADWDVVHKAEPFAVGDPAAGTTDHPIVDVANCGYVDDVMRFNRTKLDLKPWDEVANTATHEFGHVLGLEHWQNLDNCWPDSMMLLSKAQNWRNECLWNTPRSQDTAAINNTY